MAQENHCIALNNDVMIPQIGFGVFQVEDGPQTVDAVRTAIEDGYRHIDTASVYGNEASVGRAIAESGVDRADLFVTTKLWNDDIRKHRTKDAFQESLDRLGLDYVDLYLIHWPAEGWQEAWAAMQELYAQGRMRAIGVSNFERNHLAELLEQTDVLPAVDQVESSPTFPNQDLIDFCHGKDIAVEAWSPLGGTGGTLLTDQRLLDIGEKYGKSSAQVVLRWDLQRGVIPLPKSVHSTRIMQNIHVFDFELDESEMRIISSLDTGKRNGRRPEQLRLLTIAVLPLHRAVPLRWSGNTHVHMQNSKERTHGIDEEADQATARRGEPDQTARVHRQERPERYRSQPGRRDDREARTDQGAGAGRLGLDSHEAADMLAERLGAEVVQVIGNRCVLYRRSKRDDVEHIRLVRE